MSPYQQDVIDTTLQEYDIQAQKGLPALSAQAIQAGAFGGGREGIQKAEYQAQSDRNRAALQAQLLQQGFGQAQQLAANQFGQQMNLAQTTPALLGQQVSALSTLGTQQQAQQQAALTAQQQLAYQQAYQPLQAAQALGSGVTQLIAGYPGQTQQTMTPSPTALQTGLNTAATLAGIYKLTR
jgi:urease alpha subunit